MFANAQWFDEASSGFWPAPRGPKGWAFYAICLVGILVPAMVLVIRSQFPEAAVWVALGCGAMFLEMRSLRRDLAQRKAVDNLYVIDETTQPPVETEQYELELKRPS